MKNKEKGTVASELGDVLDEIQRADNETPRTIRSDNGGEFKSKQMATLAKTWGFKQLFSNAYTPQSNGMVERFNGKLKRQFRMIRVQQDDNEWEKYVPQINKNLNNTRHRVIGMTPNELHSKSAQSIPEGPLNKDDAEDGAERLQTLQEKAIANMEDEARKLQWLEPTEFEVGEMVRVRQREDMPFNFSREMFRVRKKYKGRNDLVKDQYQLEKKDGTKMSQRFDSSDLYHAHRVRHPAGAPDKYVIGKIVKPYIDKSGKRWLMLKFTDERKFRWEPYDTIKSDAPKAVSRFEELVGLQWEPELKWNVKALNYRRFPKIPPLPDEGMDNVEDEEIGSLPELGTFVTDPDDETLQRYVWKSYAKKSNIPVVWDKVEAYRVSRQNHDLKQGEWVFYLWKGSKRAKNYYVNIGVVQSVDGDNVNITYTFAKPNARRKRKEPKPWTVTNELVVPVTDKTLQLLDS